VVSSLKPQCLGARHEPPQLRVVEAGVVVVEACLVVILLAGEGVVGIGEGGIEVLSHPVGVEGVVVDRLLRVPRIVGDDGGGTEVVDGSGMRCMDGVMG
jgi:hypothetical protein